MKVGSRNSKYRWPFVPLGAVLLLSITACGGTQSSGADLLSQVKQRGVLTVGVGVYPPESGLKPDGTWYGFEADIWYSICKRLKVTCVPVLLNYVGIGPALANGTINANIGLYKTPEREKVMAYGDPVWYTALGIGARKNSGINAISDIKGKTMGTVRGAGEQTALENLIKDYPAKLVLYETGDALFLDLAAGRLDGVIWPRFLIEYGIKTNPQTYSNVKVVDNVPPKYFGGTTNQAVYYTFPLGSAAQSLIAFVNTALADMKASGETAQIFQKYGLAPTAYLNP